MRLRAARRDVPFVVDLTIALGLAFSAAFFIIVTEFCVGRGELTRAQLSLLDTNARMAHVGPTTIQSQPN